MSKRDLLLVTFTGMVSLSVPPAQCNSRSKSVSGLFSTHLRWLKVPCRATGVGPCKCRPSANAKSSIEKSETTTYFLYQ